MGREGGTIYNKTGDKSKRREIDIIFSLMGFFIDEIKRFGESLF